MNKGARESYFLAIKNRYKDADKNEKQVILNEFCQTCKYNRKYAIRKLNSLKNESNHAKRSGRKPKYDNPEIIKYLKDLYVKSNLVCSKRLKVLIPLWLPFNTEIDLSEESKRLLLEISPATIDRLLYKERSKYGKLGLSTTKPGSLIKSRIPVRTSQWDESVPGFLEADTVAHCGGTIAGSFVYSVNIVDIATGWTEQRAVWGKGQRNVYRAIESIEKSLPFKILGFDSDNGSEFINYHILSYFSKRKRPVQFTRSRPYHKNDNAHIEQKNWTHIRQYLGYLRFDNPAIVDMLSELYENEWRLFFNFFIPSMKLTEKSRIDGKTRKKYDLPKTPYQRLLESGKFTKYKMKKLETLFRKTNPYELQFRIKQKIKNILNLANFV